jgi:hypothetical protein
MTGGAAGGAPGLGAPTTGGAWAMVYRFVAVASNFRIMSGWAARLELTLSCCKAFCCEEGENPVGVPPVSRTLPNRPRWVLVGGGTDCLPLLTLGLSEIGGCV